MRQFSAVFKFEFGKYAKSKAFIIFTVIGVLLIAGFLSAPTIGQNMSEQDISSSDDQNMIGVINHSSYDTQHTLALFQSALSGYSYDVLDNTTEDDAASLVKNGDYQFIVMLKDESNYTLIAASIVLNDQTQYVIDDLMQKQYKAFLLEDQGLDSQTANDIINAAVSHTVVETGKNQLNSFFYTYIIVFLLYMMIMIYGQLVATSVASEKSSRAMETLITTVSPTKMMFGKVLGIGSVSLLQILLLLGSSILFFNLNISVWRDNEIVQSIFNIPVDMLIISAVLFILGFFLYAFIYAVIGSFAKRLEDVNSSIMPLTLLAIASFVIVMISMVSGTMDSTLLKICSYFPFTSPFALPARFAMSALQPLELVISLIVLLLSTIGIGYAAAGAYRMGVLLYGKTPSIKEIFKLLKSK